MVLSILFYGVAARVTSQEQERRLEVFHLSCIRRILKKSSYLEGMTNEQLLAEANEHSIHTKLLKLRHDLFVEDLATRRRSVHGAS